MEGDTLHQQKEGQKPWTISIDAERAFDESAVLNMWSGGLVEWLKW
jgi:hypothetical protein